MDIPADVRIKASIRPGSVYYFPSERLRGSTEPHYFVVINVDPVAEEVILLVCASSHVDTALRIHKADLETIVLVGPHEYPVFSHQSVFNCNDVFPHTIDDLVGRLARGELSMEREMDLRLVDKLRRAAVASRMVPMRYRRQLGLVP